MSIPGVAWVSLLVLVSGWLATNFEEPWVPGVVIVLGMIAKLVEIYVKQPGGNGHIDDEESMAEGMARSHRAAGAAYSEDEKPKQSHVLVRFLVG